MTETTQMILENNEEEMYMEEYEEAIIGMASRINFGPVVAYDVEKIIEILAKDMELDADDLASLDDEGETIESKKNFMAREFYEFNIVGGYHGEMMPIFVETEQFTKE